MSLYIYISSVRSYQQSPTSSSGAQEFIAPESHPPSAVYGLRGGSPRTGPVDYVDNV